MKALAHKPISDSSSTEEPQDFACTRNDLIEATSDEEVETGEDHLVCATVLWLMKTGRMKRGGIA